MGHIFGGQAGNNNQALMNQIDENIRWMAVMAVGSLVLNYFQYACFMTVAERVTTRFKQACLANLLKQEVSFLDENPPSSLAARVADQSFLVSRGIGDTMGSSIQFTSQFLVGFAISFSHNAKVAAVMLLM